MPPGFTIGPGDILKVLDPVVGGISFFNGFGPPLYGPEGNPGLSVLNPFGGISGYRGTQGALVGVFLDNSIPGGSPPLILDFTGGGLGTEFLSLTPALGQVFFIGNGVTSGNVFQEFVAPAGATRVFLGIPDGFGFVGAPGAYDDNDGAYRVRIGINETPTPVAEPSTLVLLSVGLAAFEAVRKRRLLGNRR
jgi:hypothetical protein